MHNLVNEKYNQSEKVRQSTGPEFYLLSNFLQKGSSLVNRLPRAIYIYIYMKITIIAITWIFTLFPNLKAKESYNWWLTRRILGFRQKKSDEKYLIVSVVNIGKH